jgi:hypothetical protein
VRINYRLKRTFSAAIAVRNAHQTAELQHFFHGKKLGEGWEVVAEKDLTDVCINQLLIVRAWIVRKYLCHF